MVTGLTEPDTILNLMSRVVGFRLIYDRSRSVSPVGLKSEMVMVLSTPLKSRNSLLFVIPRRKFPKVGSGKNASCHSKPRSKTLGIPGGGRVANEARLKWIGELERLLKLN